MPNIKDFNQDKDYDSRMKSFIAKKKQERDTAVRTSEVMQEIKQEDKKVAEAISTMKPAPKHFHVLRWIIIILPLLIIGYLIYNNFLISQDFTYYYDIGSQQDATKPYLTPVEGTSDVINDTALSNDYRNMTRWLVYFYVPIVMGGEDITIQTMIKDNFPNDTYMQIGAQDQQEWDYKWNRIYDSNSSSPGEWVILQTNFNIKEDNLFIKNNWLSIALDIPHLSPNNSQIYLPNNTIPLDWIKINVHKPGLLETWNQGEGGTRQT